MAVDTGSVVLAVLLSLLVIGLVVGIVHLQQTCRARIRQEKQMTTKERAKREEEIQREHQRKMHELRTEGAEAQYGGPAGVLPLSVDERGLITKALLHLECPGIPLSNHEENEGGSYWLPRGVGAWMVGSKKVVLTDLKVLMNEMKRVFYEKREDLLDEIVANLPFAKRPHPHVLLRELCGEIWQRYGAKHPTKSPLMLLAMLLYTQEVPDIDRLLLYSAPVWIEGSASNKKLWYDHLENAGDRASVRADIDKAYQELWKSTRGTEEAYQHAREACRKWAKLSCLMASLADETPAPLELYKTGLHIPTGVMAEFDVDFASAKRRLKKYVGWASPLVCSTSPNSVRTTKGNVSGKVTLRLHNVTLALDFCGLSQYPGEKAVVVPPFSMFLIESVVRDEQLGTVVDLTFEGTLLSHATDCVFTRKSRNEVWSAESRIARVRHLMDAITVTEEVPDVLYVTTGSIWDKHSIATKYIKSTRRVRGQPLWCAVSGEWYIFTSASSTRWTIGRNPESGGGRIMSEPHRGGMPQLMNRWMRSSGPSSDKGWALDPSIKVFIKAGPEPTHHLGRWRPEDYEFSSDEGSVSIGSVYGAAEPGDSRVDDGLGVPLLRDDRRSVTESPEVSMGAFDDGPPAGGYLPPHLTEPEPPAVSTPTLSAPDALLEPAIFDDPGDPSSVVSADPQSSVVKPSPPPAVVVDMRVQAVPVAPPQPIQPPKSSWTPASREQLQRLQGAWVTSTGVKVEVASLGVSYSAPGHIEQPLFSRLRGEAGTVVLSGATLLACDGSSARWGDGDCWQRGDAAHPGVSPMRLEATRLQRRDMSPHPPPSLQDEGPGGPPPL